MTELGKMLAKAAHECSRDAVRSLANVQMALPHLSRAFFFDNSGEEMRCLVSSSAENGGEMFWRAEEQPRWFRNCISGRIQK